MDYKFEWESVIDRTGTHAFAVDIIPIPDSEVKEGFTKIPMWVADMNFKTVPTIPEEMIKRAEHPLYGYFKVSDEYYDSIIDWHNLIPANEFPWGSRPGEYTDTPKPLFVVPNIPPPTPLLAGIPISTAKSPA